jgi:hypothetical protein
LLLDNFDYAIHGEEKSRIYGVMMGMHNTTTIAVSNDPMFYMQCNRVIYVTNSGSRFFDSPIEFANFYKEVLK